MPGDSVSVVMVGYGRGWAWVPKALDALHGNTAEPIEVIVVDNGGSNAAERSLPEGSCTVVHNDENIGFGPASNQGVEVAKSELLCFLNPDVLVEPGWLSPLIEAAREPDVGAVFPAKLNLDGTMQEAGAFVTGEGLSYVFGDGEDPDSPEYRFRREVDFGSAACMVVRREVFDDVGGFDPLYRLAYFEDADLCFRLRERGLRVVYVPTSRMRHARSVSAPESELRNVFETNRRSFMRRWGDTIAERPSLEELQQDPAARLVARDLHSSERILVVGDGVVGSLARTFALAHPRSRVTLLTKTIDSKRGEDLLSAGIEVVRSDAPEAWLAGRRGHYSVVVGQRGLSHVLRARLNLTQPQARFRSPEWLVAQRRAPTLAPRAARTNDRRSD